MSTSSLQVAIIGAGIAGLAAAIAIRRAGHSVEVFERSQFKNEIGAAMTMTPNGTAVLDRWKFDFVKARAVENRQTRTPNGATLEPMYRESFEDVPETYGHKMWLLHRVDFHEALRSQVEALGGTILLGSEVVDLDCDQGTLTLANGFKYKKDLIIVADGTHCKFVSQVVGHELPVRKTGRSAYRCLIPMDKIMSNPSTASLFENEQTGFMSPFLANSKISNRTLFVTYPCRNNTILNIAIPHDTSPTQNESDTWNSPASIETVLETLKDFHPTLKTMIKMVENDCKVYTLMDHAPVPTMHRKHVLLIGDAAHPLMPTHAQGGALCLEDAGALEILLSGATNENLLDRLKIFSDLRVPRCGTIHLLSNGLKEDRKVLEGMIGKFYGGELPGEGAMPYSRPFRDFFFGYDVCGEAERVLGGGEAVFFNGGGSGGGGGGVGDV